MNYRRIRNESGSAGAAVLFGLSVVVVVILVASVLSYIWFRIMAPQLGWSVPSFSAIFWSSFFVSVPLGVFVVIARS